MGCEGMTSDLDGGGGWCVGVSDAAGGGSASDGETSQGSDGHSEGCHVRGLVGIRRVKLLEEGARMASSAWGQGSGGREWESWKRDRSVLQVAGRSQTEGAGSQSVSRHLRGCSLSRLALGKSRTTKIPELSRSHSPPNPQALLSSQESESLYLLSKDPIPHPGAEGPLAACPPPGSYLSVSLSLAPVIPLVFLHPRH